MADTLKNGVSRGGVGEQDSRNLGEEKKRKVQAKRGDRVSHLTAPWSERR